MSESAPAPSGPNDAQLGAVTEQELDDLLCSASGLAGEVSKQVGAPETAPGAPPPPLPVELSATLDDELSRLDGLLTSTASDVGAGPKENALPGGPGANPGPPPTATGTNAASRAVPDFMLEFTEPAPAAPSAAASTKSPSAKGTLAAPHPTDADPTPTAPDLKPPPPAESPAAVGLPGGTQTPAPHKPGVVGTGMLGVVRTATPDTDTASVDSETTVSNAMDAPARPVRTWKVPGPLLAIARIAARALEILDRPFASLGAGVKDLIGWIALATLGTALVVFLTRVI